MLECQKRQVSMAPSVFMPKKLYGVLGWPLGHSLSPLIHNTGFQRLGLPGIYMKWEVRPADLAAFATSVRVLPISGCSVTIPHKIEIMPLLDRLEKTAELAGAVNTIFWRDGELCGENTDVAGFLCPLASLPLENLDIILLGAGGAAAAAAAGLSMRGCRSARICTPGNRRQIDLARRFGFEPIAWEERYSRAADLIVNATPLGMAGEHASESPYDFEKRPTDPPGIAYDIVYNPLRTVFLSRAAARGWRIISGEKMFFGQADAQFRRWTGQPLPAAARLALGQALQAN